MGGFILESKYNLWYAHKTFIDKCNEWLLYDRDYAAILT